MASVSLQSRLTLNSRLSIKKPAHEARVSLVMKLFQGGFAACGNLQEIAGSFMLNCKLSRWAQDIGALTVIMAR